MSKDLEKFQQQQKHLIESLDSYYDKWSNSDFSQVIDRLSAVAKNLIEENQKIDSTAKLLKKKIQQLSMSSPSNENKNDDNDDEKNSVNNDDETKIDIVPFADFTDTIRLYQKKIEYLMKRYNETSEIIISLRNCLSNLPDVIPILTESVNFLKSEVQPQIDNLNLYRQEISDLKTNDSQIESLENQIREVKANRDLILQKINNEALNNVEAHKSNQVKQIEESIKLIQMQKTEIETQMQSIQSDIKEYEKKKINLDSVEQENLKKFLDESSKIENELANLRSKLDELKEIDLEKKVDDLRNDLSQKNLELQQKQNLISSLKAELNLRSVKLTSSSSALNDSNLSLNSSKSISSSNVFLENEVEHLEEELNEKQKELDSLPSIDEWKEVSSELKNFQSNQNSTFSEFDVDFDFVCKIESDIKIELSTIENQIKTSRKEQVNIDSQLNVISSQIEQKEKEIQNLYEQKKKIINSNDENAMIEVLKIRKAVLNDEVQQKENERHNLEREQKMLDIRIKSLTEEKENLINFSTPANSSFLQPIQMANTYSRSGSGIERRKKKKMKKIERKMINLADILLGTPKKTFFVLLYLIVLIILVLYMFL